MVHFSEFFENLKFAVKQCYQTFTFEARQDGIGRLANDMTLELA